MKFLRNFLWFCSGAHINLLKKCPTEGNKYAGIGGTVLFTGIFAGISAGYALLTVFQTIWVSLAFGFIWGIMIFNLDRFIVASMKKKGSFANELGMAAPRLLLAILLAFVISKPLELKIFEREIMQVIETGKAQQNLNAIEAVNKNYSDINVWQNQIDLLRDEIREKEKFRNQKQEEYDLERFGVKTAGTSGIPGIGRNAALKEQQLKDAQSDLENTRNNHQQQIERLQQNINRLHAMREQDIQSNREKIDDYSGFAARIEALSILTAQNKAIYMANIFIILLFIAVETAPIFVKLISAKGPYDYLLEKHEYSFMKYNEEKITRMENESLEEIRTIQTKTQNKLLKELEVSHVTTQEMINAKIEIASKAIHAWKEQELEKIQKLPEIDSKSNLQNETTTDETIDATKLDIKEIDKVWKV